MPETPNLYVHLDPDVKESVQEILSALGIPVSTAITMFYEQIILQHGIPFEARLPPENVADMSKLSQQELDAELEKGYQDVLACRTKPVSRVFDEIRQAYGM